MSIYYRNTFQRSFGTFPLTGDEAHQAIAAAAEAGYRAFDTAQMYGNEEDTGAALRATGVPREELCVTTKVHPDNFDEARFRCIFRRTIFDRQLQAVSRNTFGRLIHRFARNTKGDNTCLTLSFSDNKYRFRRNFRPQTSMT